MRTYEQLTSVEQTQAHEKALSAVLTAICEGAIRFNDKLNHDRLQQRIDKAVRKAENMQTPWFAHEYIMEDRYCADRIVSMAVANAEDAIYLDAGENAVRLAANLRIQTLDGEIPDFAGTVRV